TEAPPAEPPSRGPPPTHPAYALTELSPAPADPTRSAITPVHDGSSPSFSASRRAQGTPRHRGLAGLLRDLPTDGSTRPSSAKPPTRRHGVPGTLGGDARSVLGRDRRVISC